MDKEVYWSRYARDFEERNNYVAGKRNIKAIKQTLSEQNLTGDVLDLGCGNGTYSKVLAQTVDRVFATDWSDEMVNVCRVRLRLNPNIFIKKENCFGLSFPASHFDAVVMINLLHVIPEPEKAIRESRRVLKKGGDIVVISFTAEGMGLLSKLGMIFRYLRKYGKPPETSRRLTVDMTKTMLESEDFTIGEARLIGKNSKAVFVRATKR
jgi:ubiquinone/menaquinone biosynthesis C-methylase UbiE